MASFAVTERAQADVREILTYTLERWGENQYWEYAELIEAGYSAIAEDPSRGRPRSEVHTQVLSFHIKQPARNARHILFYTHDVEKDRVLVLRVLHDSMDFDRHLP